MWSINTVHLIATMWSINTVHLIATMWSINTIKWFYIVTTIEIAASINTLATESGNMLIQSYANNSDVLNNKILQLIKAQRLDVDSLESLEVVEKYILRNIALPSFNLINTRNKPELYDEKHLLELLNKESAADDIREVVLKDAHEPTSTSGPTIPSLEKAGHPSPVEAGHPSLEKAVHPSLEKAVHPSPVEAEHPSLVEAEHPSSSRVKRQSSFSGGIGGVMSQLFNVPEELHMLTPGLVKRYGYPFEEHFVTTPDGYILGLHRIPGSRFTKSDQLPSFNPKVVLLTHCAACSSSDFVMGKPELSLGFLLADAGYDVWMANYRGNTYSRNHTSLDPDRQREFWHFSLDEIAFYDLPMTVNYVRGETRVDKIFYIGHSLGTLAFYMSASTSNSMVDKICLMVGMAPTAFRDNVSGPMAVGMQLANMFRGLLEFGTGEMMARNRLVYTTLYLLCNGRSAFSDTCVTMLTAAGGGVNKGFFKKEETPFILAHFPAGISVRALAHVGQLITSNGMQMFDYGPVVNEQKYGSPTPPRYSLDAVTCPTALYWTNNDYLSAPKDVARLAAALPHLVFNRAVSEPDFNHMDFLLADTARTLVYDSILKLMEIF